VSCTWAVWLRSLGLERYEQAFRENEIDETVLASLTHETLKELGVTAVGHRLKLLDAIAALHRDTSGPGSSDEATRLGSDGPPQIEVVFATVHESGRAYRDQQRCCKILVANGGIADIGRR
jgi:hypothetical protein